MCALSRQAVTAERHARVANLGLGFHQVGPFEFLDTTGYEAPPRRVANQTLLAGFMTRMIEPDRNGLT